MKNRLTYKGFIGSVDYNSDDDVFHGKVEMISDLVSFEGRSTKELKNAFQHAVEDYLALCEEIGKEPSKTYKGTFNVRIDPDLHQKAVEHATARGMSLNQFVQRSIEIGVRMNQRVVRVRSAVTKQKSRFKKSDDVGKSAKKTK